MKITDDKIEIDFSQLDHLVDKFPTQVVDRAMNLTAQELLRNVKIEAPGKIPQTTRMKKISESKYAILINHIAWRFIQFGTRKDYPIEAVNAKALYFFWEKKGEWVFFKRVIHPGIKANPFVERAIDSTQGRISEFVQMALDGVKL
jgi:hypothetical protein